ncbi:MAG: hypothetical protein ABW220_16265 [Burkholderiaceae bacterium]
MRGWVAASLAALLLSAQGFGLWHRTVHGPAAAHAHVGPSGATTSAQATPAFGHDAGQTDQCRLFDQLALADLLLVATAMLPVAAPQDAAIEVAVATGARSTPAPYDARAPPIEA